MYAVISSWLCFHSVEGEVYIRIICNAHAQVMETENSITLTIFQCKHIYSTRMALRKWLWVLQMNILTRTGTT